MEATLLRGVGALAGGVEGAAAAMREPLSGDRRTALVASGATPTRTVLATPALGAL